MSTNVLMNTYAPLPVRFVKGQGPWLWDDKGNKYLDTFAGIAVCSLGHAHPAVKTAIKDQAGKLIHTSNAFEIPNQVALAEKLVALSGMENAFFCNSGAEADETALKLSRLYGHQRDITNPAVIVMEKAFHGRTLSMISASGSRKVQAGFEPLVQGFVRAPFNDLAALETIAENRQDIVAIMMEPIQGEGGIIVPDEDYLRGVREICTKHDWLMVLDEVQTGIGRTGKFFAYQHANILPDIVTSAKALGNGIPIGACLARGVAAQLFKPGNHGTTYGGNPFATRIALTVLNTLEHEKLLEHVTECGDYLMASLNKNLKGHANVVDIRGKGLMIGVELDRPAMGIKKIALEKGVLLNVTAESVIRLVPPFTLTGNEMDLMVSVISESIAEFVAQPTDG